MFPPSTRRAASCSRSRLPAGAFGNAREERAMTVADSGTVPPTTGPPTTGPLTTGPRTRTSMHVRKRNGDAEPVDVNKIVRAVDRCADGLAEVDPLRVATKTIS